MMKSTQYYTQCLMRERNNSNVARFDAQVDLGFAHYASRNMAYTLRMTYYVYVDLYIQG